MLVVAINRVVVAEGVTLGAKGDAARVEDGADDVLAIVDGLDNDKAKRRDAADTNETVNKAWK